MAGSGQNPLRLVLLGCGLDWGALTLCRAISGPYPQLLEQQIIEVYFPRRFLHIYSPWYDIYSHYTQFLLSILILGVFITIASFRGSWYLMDLYFLPEAESTSQVLGMIIGALILCLLKLISCLHAGISSDSHR